MTHVLLDTNLDSGKDIRQRLGRWGMTTGACAPSDPGFQWPTILECDLMIMDAGAAKDLCSVPPSYGDSLAPIILLGVSGFLLLARDAWQVLSQSNPDSKDLRMAVQTCLEQTALMRHGPAAGQDREDFLSFLGHEMRSPLTAAKTALEVLQGDLGGLASPEADPDPHLKMLEIALRNVRRLHHTVEWSQELMASSPVQQNIHLGDMDAFRLKQDLDRKFSSHWEPDALNLKVHTNGDSLCTLMDQIVRALQYAVPDCKPALHASCSNDQQGALSLTLSPARGSVQDGAPRVSRLGLTSGVNGDSPVAELERLVRFVVSGILVSSLDVDLEVSGGSDEELQVRILVPAVVTDSPVGELLTPA